MFKLYDYFRSSACFRVRIALNLKNLPFESIPIHLLKEGGEQFQPHYRTVNPQTLVPSLKDTKNNTIITQSLSIIEYLEENFPLPRLLPEDIIKKAHVRAFAQAIACDIHPLNNLRVLQYLKHHLHVHEDQKNQWYFHWLSAGFNSLEQILSNQPQRENFCFGEHPSLADVCLIPQVYNAVRYEFPMRDYPLIKQIYDFALKHTAFNRALPENQPDAND